MARTKQTARKTVGGPAPRQLLGMENKQQQQRAAVQRQEKSYVVLVTTETGNKFVHMNVTTHRGVDAAAQDAWEEVQENHKKDLKQDDDSLYLVLVKSKENHGDGHLITFFSAVQEEDPTHFASLSFKADVKLREFIRIGRLMMLNH